MILKILTDNINFYEYFVQKIRLDKYSKLPTTYIVNDYAFLLVILTGCIRKTTKYLYRLIWSPTRNILAKHSLIKTN